MSCTRAETGQCLVKHQVDKTSDLQSFTNLEKNDFNFAVRRHAVPRAARGQRVRDGHAGEHGPSCGCDSGYCFFVVVFIIS